jgi:hypothetical protein
MVPLENVLRKPGSEPVPGFVLPELTPRAADPEPRRPRAFKVIDVMTRRPLAEDVDARAAVEALEDIRSIVDVSVFVWEPQPERWRRLTFGETQLLWDQRGRMTGAHTPRASYSLGR